MSTVTGGMRYRLISDSLMSMLQTALTILGWTATGRQHVPVTLRNNPVGLDEEVPFNTVAIEPGPGTDTEAEFSSNMTIDDWLFYIDVYAESRSLGIQLSGDIRDILRGKSPDTGRLHPILNVYDYRDGSNTLLFTVQIDRVTVDPAQGWPQPWKQHWYSISFRIQDENDG